ncbi:PEP/pyruvate-binding domain-containing protein [Dehalobacter sp. DCM]|uniref:PEP/pyruvate-binding domain-containing protein n=1 Tax=Dehalobacter sp. DCM TaxID=2907827 RepID=UPI003081D247|nr:PEP/pyruvate-binding domain-containing protein [Dehalobacter sp. DCM]
MAIQDKVDSGLSGFDHMIDHLRLGDNVVWQVDTVEHYKTMVGPFINQAVADGRNVVYVRFGSHPPLIEENPHVIVYSIDAKKGFESFAMAIHDLIAKEGRKTFYVFDCLTDLLKYWHSDLMIGNFFKVTCPFLFELDTIAYFALRRNIHTNSTIATIRDTTQLLLDLYYVKNKYYIHPLKVWQRYSPTMFFPHLIDGQEAVSITASVEAAELFSCMSRGEERLDYWDAVFQKASKALLLESKEQEEAKRMLMTMLIGSESRMFQLCDRYFTLKDILNIAAREVGTGFVGGKTVGMLVARKILEKDGKDRFIPKLEPHDSFYIGSDVFYTYIVQNNLWELRTRQKTEEGYFIYAPELKEKILKGHFPGNIQEQFMQMLEYFGQSPIIVRSSSLLEDNFGNAFAGKYESVFCANQGTPEERYLKFEQAVRTVYASMMDEDALAYRMNRGLFQKDEQMAVLVQRVSGDYYGESFFPHAAGVGNSSNSYIWDPSINMDAGMLRLVFGLGTRAVDRTVEDYARIVTLDDPLRVPMVNYGDRNKFSQHFVDLLSLECNALSTVRAEAVLAYDLKVDQRLFVSIDYETVHYLRQLGRSPIKTPYIIDFETMLRDTDFPLMMREMLALLSKVYNYPVDIEFTVNFLNNKEYRVNLLQCRPLQTRGLGKTVEMPVLERGKNIFLSSHGNFMGGNVRLPIDYVVIIKSQAYHRLDNQSKYSIARQVGLIDKALKGKNAMLIGPGRWGTTTPSLGVPVHFTELSNMTVICEVSSREGFMPELSYGSHFFQDLVETGIFYVAVFEGKKDVVYHPEYVLDKENILDDILPNNAINSDVIHIAETKGMEIFSDIVSQKLICC